MLTVYYYNKGHYLLKGGSFQNCDWTVALLVGEGYGKVPSNIMGKVKSSQKTGRTGFFYRFGLTDWTVKTIERISIKSR